MNIVVCPEYIPIIRVLIQYALSRLLPMFGYFGFRFVRLVYDLWNHDEL